MIIKTRASLAERGAARRSRSCTPTRRRRSWCMPIESVDEAYLAWLMAETGDAPE